jgi:hypothetical protein
MKKLLLFALISLLFSSSFAQENKKPVIEIYGQVMTDIGYHINQVNPLYFDVMRPTQLPSFKNEYGTDGNVFFSVRQSSLGIRSHYDTRKGYPLTAVFAFDLFGVGPNVGQTTFHLLYAYVEWWKVGVGYTWSQFTDFDVYPNIVEYWGPVGLSLCKTTMIKFMPLIGKNLLSIALESPGATADGGIYRDRIEFENVEEKFDLPDLTAEYRMTRNWGYVELTGVIRKIEWLDQAPDSLDYSGKATGWGFNLSTNLNLGKKDVFKGQVVIGEGIQNFMNDAPTDIGVVVDPENPNDPIKAVALPVKIFSAYLDHSWSNKLTSTIGFSAVYIGMTNGNKPSDFKIGQYSSVNLLYHPTDRITMGGEVQWIRRVNNSDAWEVTDTRIQLSFRYSFGESLSVRR